MNDITENIKMKPKSKSYAQVKSYLKTYAAKRPEALERARQKYYDANIRTQSTYNQESRRQRNMLFKPPFVNVFVVKSGRSQAVKLTLRVKPVFLLPVLRPLNYFINIIITMAIEILVREEVMHAHTNNTRANNMAATNII